MDLGYYVLYLHHGFGNKRIVRLERTINEYLDRAQTEKEMKTETLAELLRVRYGVDVQKDNLLLEKPQYRIRKLTPRECGRLMGVSDEDIDKMAAVNSNTQLYKQFGNSIVVDVMCAMFKNLNIKQGDNNETLQTN